MLCGWVSAAPLRLHPCRASLRSMSVARSRDTDAVFVVTGAGGGIGGEFVRQLADRSSARVMACSRTASSMPSTPRVVPVDMDVSDPHSIQTACEEIAAYGRVDLVLNVAGMLGAGRPKDPGPERALRELEWEWAVESFKVNTLAPAMVVKGLEASLRASAKAGHQPVVANLSARVSSIGDNGLGGWWSYRASKAALNMMTRNMHLELKRQGIVVIGLHPGTVETKLSAPFAKNVRPDKLFTPEYSVSKMLEVVDGADEAASGTLFDYAGERIEW